MITNVTNFGRSGLADWIVQRVSGVILAAYTLFIVGFMVCNEVTFESWTALHSMLPMKIFNMLAILSLGAHAWIGIWCVLTDYITTRLMGTKGTVLRVFAQLICAIVTLIYVIWAIEILWGI